MEGEIEASLFDSTENFQGREHAQRAIEPPTHIMAKPADSNYPYVLSSVPQTQLVRRLRIYVVLLFAGFLLGGTLAVWMINMRF